MIFLLTTTDTNEVSFSALKITEKRRYMFFYKKKEYLDVLFVGKTDLSMNGCWILIIEKRLQKKKKKNRIVHWAM